MQNLHAAQQRSQPVKHYVKPASLEEALITLAAKGSRAKVIAGGTDLILELARGEWSDVDTLVDLSVLNDLNTITLEKGQVKLGPLVTHSDVLGWDSMPVVGLPLAQACLEVGSPQLRNRATIAGNLVTASPANDTISALYALKASITVAGKNGCERTIPMAGFIDDYRSTVLKPGELVTGIAFEALDDNRRGVFIKLGLRRAQAISVVHAAIVMDTTTKVDSPSEKIEDLTVALGSVAPTVVVSETAREVAYGRNLNDPKLAADVAAAACKSIAPMDDLRSTAEYRKHVVEVMIKRGIRSLQAGTQAATWPQSPPRLCVRHTSKDTSDREHSPNAISAKTLTTISGSHRTGSTGNAGNAITDNDEIVVTVNGIEHRAAHGVSRTLLDWLRLETGLTGTKEGCAEGECGACTVHLDRQAVLACLIPAARAHKTEVTTIEGISPARQLHPVQKALVDGVQCGFCTPGFVMSAVMLSKENPNPSRSQIEYALSGNLCRCTGYYPITEAIRSLQYIQNTCSQKNLANPTKKGGKPPEQASTTTCQTAAHPQT